MQSCASLKLLCCLEHLKPNSDKQRQVLLSQASLEDGLMPALEKQKVSISRSVVELFAICLIITNKDLYFTTMIHVSQSIADPQHELSHSNPEFAGFQGKYDLYPLTPFKDNPSPKYKRQVVVCQKCSCIFYSIKLYWEQTVCTESLNNKQSCIIMNEINNNMYCL